MTRSCEVWDLISCRRTSHSQALRSRLQRQYRKARQPMGGRRGGVTSSRLLRHHVTYMCVGGSRLQLRASRFCPLAHVYIHVSSSQALFMRVLEDDTVFHHGHVGPCAQSTVALARGVSISLCRVIFRESGIESDVYHHCTSSVCTDAPPVNTHIPYTHSSDQETQWTPEHLSGG